LSIRLETTPSRPWRQAARRNASPSQASWGLKSIPGGRRAEQSRKAALALREPRGGDGLAVELKEIEQVIDEACAALVGGLLHKAEVGNAIWTHGAEFAVEIGGSDGKLR
jgi:hypothetical protein